MGGNKAAVSKKQLVTLTVSYFSVKGANCAGN